MTVRNRIVNSGITRRSIVSGGEIEPPPVLEVVTFEGVTVTYLGEDVTHTEA